MDSKRKREGNPLLNEINIMRACDHPQIIKLFEVYEADKHVHLVMEVLDGGELFNRIRSKGTYTEVDAIKVMRNILASLAYLEEKGIVHRDLKPENLILASNEDDYNVKIADFGLAAFIAPGEKLDLPCGSPGYVAYELLQDPSPGYDCKADIFSVGVILYILLSGRPAFHGTDYKQILAKNKQGDPPYPKRFWDKISENGQDLVKKMLEKDQDLRLSAKQCLQHSWFDEEESSKVGDNVIDNFEELPDYAAPAKDEADASNPLLTVTPVMAGRKLKDTCESPWNPSGYTPKMNPQTPLLRHGFGDQPKKPIVIPGIGPIGMGASAATAVVDNNPEPPKQEKFKNKDLADLAKLDEIDKKRKQRLHHGTKNFGGTEMKVIKKMTSKDEEDKIDPITNIPIIPKKLEKSQCDNDNKGTILDKILKLNQSKDSEAKIVMKSDENLKPDKRYVISDTEVNI